MSSIIHTGAQESPRSSVLIQKSYEIIKNHGRMVDKAYNLYAVSENFRKKEFSFSHTFDMTVDMPEDFEPRHCIVGYTGCIDLYPNSGTYYHFTGPCTSGSPNYCYASFYDYDVLGNTTRMTRTNRYRDFKNSSSRGEVTVLSLLLFMFLYLLMTKTANSILQLLPLTLIFPGQSRQITQWLCIYI